MRAALLERPGPIDASPGPLRIVDRPDPVPGPDEIVVRVTACGVCRTDLQIVEGDIGARRLPIVPGHQPVGRVVAVGGAVEGWAVGDRAGVGWLAGTCGRCAHCVAGRENLCTEATFTGWDRDGGFADAIAIRASAALRLPAGFADIDSAPLLCGGVIGYRSLRVSGIAPGGRLGLYGFGASALIAIQVARHWGCEVHVATRADRERARALALGAASVGGYDDPPPHPLDAAITFAPSGDVVVAALRAVDRGGTVAINAIHLDRIPAFDYDLLWWERTLRSVANSTRRDAVELLELAATIPIRTTVTRFPLDEAGVALATLKAGRVDGAAVLEMA
jgi:propanol-preferring alcohol dehydrogenase